jgi:hypothetical protein
MVVREQAEPQQQAAQSIMVRQYETKRTNDVRRDLPEDFALDQRSRTSRNS